jgi:hypothetical protein
VEKVTGLMILLELVSHVTQPVELVPNPTITPVLDVSLITTYIKENVYQVAQITSGPTIKVKLVNLVSTHVRNVSDQTIVIVTLVTLVTSYSIPAVNQIVHLNTGTIWNITSVLLVPLNVENVTTTELTETVLNVNHQTISSEDSVDQPVQMDIIPPKTQ